ncbi:hypothetical protein CJ030_MR7G015222 [Morella rubra]|uniref:Uncharacterized protein n=1 Tax=Morella rubra TaxID=262757 RepID=A0A6A1UWX4_9ROSI|nr:hypothetical protein CJ030_MR7G015222 [Morella rubra]
MSEESQKCWRFMEKNVWLSPTHEVHGSPDSSFLVALGLSEAVRSTQEVPDLRKPPKTSPKRRIRSGVWTPVLALLWTVPVLTNVVFSIRLVVEERHLDLRMDAMQDLFEICKTLTLHAKQKKEKPSSNSIRASGILWIIGKPRRIVANGRKLNAANKQVMLSSSIFPTPISARTD